MKLYGMTETISQTHMNPSHKARKQCLGFPIFDTESRVINLKPSLCSDRTNRAKS